VVLRRLIEILAHEASRLDRTSVVDRLGLRIVVQAEEAAGISELGLATLRRLKTGDPAASGWPVIARWNSSSMSQPQPGRHRVRSESRRL